MAQFIPKKDEKEVISIRLSTKLIKAVDTAASESNLSRNIFINQCIEYALQNMNSDDSE